MTKRMNLVERWKNAKRSVVSLISHLKPTRQETVDVEHSLKAGCKVFLLLGAVMFGLGLLVGVRTPQASESIHPDIIDHFDNIAALILMGVAALFSVFALALFSLSEVVNEMRRLSNDKAATPSSESDPEASDGS